jgi:anti-anti-sigma factor
MELSVDLGAGVPVIRITGDMRLWGKQEVADEIRESLYSLMVAGHKRIVVNLSSVRRIDSRGIGCLARIHATAITKNAEISLVLAAGQVMDALQQLNFVKLYPIFADEPAALARAKGAS